MHVELPRGHHQDIPGLLHARPCNSKSGTIWICLDLDWAPLGTAVEKHGKAMSFSFGIASERSPFAHWLRIWASSHRSSRSWTRHWRFRCPVKRIPNSAIDI